MQCASCDRGRDVCGGRVVVVVWCCGVCDANRRELLLQMPRDQLHTRHEKFSFRIEQLHRYHENLDFQIHHVHENPLRPNHGNLDFH